MAKIQGVKPPPGQSGGGRGALVGTLILAVVILIVVKATWHTFFKYVPPGSMLVIIHKTGGATEPGQILAREGQKGIQEEVLGEGRHFVMPFVNDTELKPCIEIPVGKVGVVTAKDGKPMPAGRMLAERGEEGMWREVLPPGRYRLNPYAYTVEVRDAIRIRAGFVGFVTNLLGKEPKGRFAGDDEKGVRADVLEPGIYYLNPHATRVEEIEVGVNQVTFLDEQVIRFPSADAFEIQLEATVEWELPPASVAQVMSEFGKVTAIEEKVLVPQSKSIGRLAGSRYGAKDFLLGEGREKFQTAFTEELEKICEEKHVEIHSAFIRHIQIPATLLRPIQEAFISVEKQKTAKYWEETRKTAAELEREQALIVQRTQEVEAETAALVQRISATAEQEVGKIDAETRQLVAQRQQEIAQLDAKRTLALGQANASVQKKIGQARASAFTLKVQAFGGDADAFRRFTFAEELPGDFTMRLVQAGEGTFWTDVVGTAGMDDLVKLKMLRETLTPGSTRKPPQKGQASAGQGEATGR